MHRCIKAVIYCCKTMKMYLYSVEPITFCVLYPRWSCSLLASYILCSRVSLATYLMCSCISRVSCLACSCASRAFCFPCSHVPSAFCLMCSPASPYLICFRCLMPNILSSISYLMLSCLVSLLVLVFQLFEFFFCFFFQPGLRLITTICNFCWKNVISIVFCIYKWSKTPGSINL